ncbi:MAG: hypothetical protein MUP76_05460, partial [Acidimicrobiia bacterium]|nr:hypothetical protein [Acidimicrobiia bacterium]
MTRRIPTILTAIAVLASACGGGTETSASGWLGGEPEWSRSGVDGVGGAVPEASTALTTMVEGPDYTDPVAAPQLGLSAGAVDDNDSWDDYLLYRRRFLESGIPVHDVDITGRRIVTVTRFDGSPVLGATVGLLDADGSLIASALTSSDGTALLFPVGDVDGMKVSASKGTGQAEAALDPATREHSLTLEAPSIDVPIALDILFLIDVTGSMGDEIDRLK